VNAPLWLTAAAIISTAVSITAFEILMALALVAQVALKRPWSFPPIWRPLALFMLGTVVSLAASGHMREGLPQIRKFYVYLLLFLAASVFENVAQIRMVTVLWSIAAACSAAWGLWQYFVKYMYARDAHLSFYSFYVTQRITGFTDHWMTLGGEMMIMLLLIGALVFFGRGRTLLLAALPIGLALEYTWTRSMWVGAICGGAYLIWFWRRWALLLLPVAGGILWLASPAEMRERALSSFFPHGDMDSNQHREELRAIGWRMIEAHPWLGVGPEQVSRQVGNYTAHLIPGEYYGHLENDYLQYAAERGVPTMLALLWMIGWALADFIRALPRAGEARWVLHAAIAVIISMLVSGFGSWNLNNSHLLAMLMTVVGWGYVAVKRKTISQSR
jgi:putative inorganic carbon (HCO3(-)) transporter